MKKSAFKLVLSKIPELNFQQREKLVDAAQHIDERQQVNDLAEHAFAENPHCPHCQGKNLGTKGHDRSGLVRYICRDCKKTFNALHETPLFRMHRTDRWLSNCREMIAGNVIRKTAENIGVSNSCAFRMRHKTLTYAHDHEDDKLGGIVEMDEVLFPYSEKGSRHIKHREPRRRGGVASKRGASREQVSVITCTDRSRHELDFIGGFGAVKANVLNFELKSIIEADAILVTDMAKAFHSFAKEQALTHVRLNTSQKEHAKGAMHIQHVNSYQIHFKDWLDHFRGVATKYLEHYLGWFHELFSKKVRVPESFLALSLH